ncbi:hypothetical protein EDWATA_03755 [Edwardsiella tarda ATCC 23685]|uniref:Uncharacterized protein n=1 Tax=Edwardsiella tarda ATCC 23685 TaxID=500638 RepID=D4FAD7_EDWTA|nr:hypothetical protein EDWATA_03755 [Edwardsiella tarda ATCC 23685]
MAAFLWRAATRFGCHPPVTSPSSGRHPLVISLSYAHGMVANANNMSFITH